MTDKDDMFFDDDTDITFDDEPFLKVDRDDFIELREAHNHTVVVVSAMQKVVNLSLFMNLILAGCLAYTFLTLSPVDPSAIKNPLIQEQQQEVTK